MSNVLISSVSKKVPLIKSVRDALHRFSPDSLVIGGDSNPECLGRYFVDEFWQMPATEDLSVNALIDYCKKADVRFIIPTRDGELSFFAEHRQHLAKAGIDVMISSGYGVALALDKLAFSKEFERSIPTFLDYRQLKSFPCVVKARYGAGSRTAGIGLMLDEAIDHGSTLSDAVYQSYIQGIEISVDFYVKSDHTIHGMICRERNMIVDGESQITTTFRDKELEELCSSSAASMDLYGHVMFQLIRESSTGSLYLLECNPRFGGASTASVQAGLDSFYWFFCEADQKPLPPFSRLKNEIKMVRHAEDIFFDS